MSKNKIETTLKQTTLLEHQIDVKYTKLYDYQGNMDKRWSVAFKVWDFAKGGFSRRFDYEVNKQTSKAARYRYARNRIKEINEVLLAGACVGLDATAKIKRRSIEKAFQEIMKRKSVEYAQRTKESMKSSIVIFMEFVNVSNIGKTDIKKLSKNHLLQYRDWLLDNRKISARTVNNYLSYINILLNAMIERNWIESNPLQSIKKLKQSDTLKNREITPAELDLLIPVLKKNFPLWLFVQFVYYCWIRPREITFIKVKDLDLINGRVFLHADNTKNKRSNFVNIPGPLLEILKGLELPYNSNQYLFARDGKNKLFGYKKFADNRFTYYHSAIRDDLGLSKEIKMYSWKRCGVCAAYRAGAGIYEIMKHGRWQDLKEVQTYMEKSGLMIHDELSVNIPII